MSDWDALNEFLRTDPRDIGCDLALDALPAYSEMAAAGGHPERLFPGLAAHLKSCRACFRDYEALVRAIREFGGDEPR
ncbi:MAG TPA: hypothetical protein VGL47_47995 [Amycolatopsis sp.]|uniref:hypothetical protein n=1 Tax=Amycolatopsis sp. TaxID=37632 RepID=UPI002F403EDD